MWRREKLPASVLNGPVRGVDLLVRREPLVNLGERHGPTARHELLKDVPLLLEILLQSLVDRGVQLVLGKHLAPVVVDDFLDRSDKRC